MNRKAGFFVTSVLLAVVGGMSLIPATATPKLSVTSTLHTTTIPLQIYNPVLTTPTRAFVWNFSVNLAGKDVGSDRFNLVVDASGVSPEGSVPLLLLFSDRNLTDWLSAPLTAHSGQQFAYAGFAPSTFATPTPPSGLASTASAITIDFMPAASGTYHIVAMNPDAFANLVPGVQANVHFEIHGYEIWTTTIVG